MDYQQTIDKHEYDITREHITKKVKEYMIMLLNKNAIDL